MMDGIICYSSGDRSCRQTITYYIKLSKVTHTVILHRSDNERIKGHTTSEFGATHYERADGAYEGRLIRAWDAKAAI